jgi:hypothetical protein
MFDRMMALTYHAGAFGMAPVPQPERIGPNDIQSS